MKENGSYAASFTVEDQPKAKLEVTKAVADAADSELAAPADDTFTFNLYDESGKATKNKEPWERRAEFPGGNTAFRDAIKSTLKYPKDAFKAHVTGRVIMQFTINKEGQMVNPKFLRRLHPSLDQEAMRVIETIGKKYTWEPSISQGEKVNDKMVIPIVFNLLLFIKSNFKAL